MVETLGFLTVRQHAEHGYFGGFLVLNTFARPLEFHCTLPLKPSRAQVLLYGPTIHDFVCGEQIAAALIDKAKLKPALVLTDCLAALALSQVSDRLVAMVPEEGEQPAQAGGLEKPPSKVITRELMVGEQRLLVPFDSAGTEEKIADCLDDLAAYFELDEPFQRILDALLEAHPIAKAA